MKKSLLALVVLSALGTTAQAQSNVTVYGVVDVGFAKQTGKKLIQRENHASRLGFRGVEDLGNGVSVVFTLENEFLLDSGAQKGVFWERQANVGFTGGFGTVVFGRTKNLIDSVQPKVEPFGADGVIGKVNEPMMRVGVSSSRVSNSVTYTSQKMNGFGVAGQYVLSEIDGASNGYSVLGSYDKGNAFAYIGFEKAAETKAGTEQPQMWTTGGYYKFGALRLSAQYAHGDTKVPATGEYTGMLFGAVYTVGKGDFKAVVSKQRQETAAFERDTVKEVGVGYDYHLSKRTDLYAYAGRERVSRVTSYQVGISHKF